MQSVRIVCVVLVGQNRFPVLGDGGELEPLEGGRRWGGRQVVVDSVVSAFGDTLLLDSFLHTYFYFMHTTSGLTSCFARSFVHAITE